MTCCVDPAAVHAKCLFGIYFAYITLNIVYTAKFSARGL